ncbi:tRNA pseudouridine synthase-like 1 isoform X2 [Anolis sagrei]|uniref:tRNA pseudouridine synthase-like 1 isoform X2 n=1 Tax=Anolis sagrei TaxID=38937 RepID=UPI0035218BC7
MLSQRARYLISFQYCGTMYSGVMETPPDQAKFGVQNYLEKAAEKLRPLVPIKFVISSRTDAGVHALCNTAHIDVERSGGKPPFSESVLVQALNRNLKPEPIRVLGARRVSDTFHARFSALSRTYVYRVATGCSWPSELLPVFEQNLCWVTQRGELKFWELEFTSRSFLYKQVRRMAGVLVAVGQHRLDPEHVKKLLEIRDLMAYPSSTMAPACGLFLKNVEYCEADLEIGRTEAET